MINCRGNLREWPLMLDPVFLIARQRSRYRCGDRQTGTRNEDSRQGQIMQLALAQFVWHGAHLVEKVTHGTWAGQLERRKGRIFYSADRGRRKMRPSVMSPSAMTEGSGTAPMVRLSKNALPFGLGFA